MAYSNWGAFVHCNGERRTDREDVAVFNDDEKDTPSGGRIFANLIKNREKYPNGNPPWHEHSQHAVLGDGPIRLVGYKCYASLCELTDSGEVVDVDLTPFTIGEEDDGYGRPVLGGEYKGVTFKATPFNGNMIDLVLTEADNASWEARCGMSYGAGHMD